MQHRFVEFIPDNIEADVLYITIEYCTAIHLCMCGCGNKVVTPFSPKDWKLGFDGETISLSPSIGNWSFECQSHYWIKNSKIRWADKWDSDKIESERRLNSKVEVEKVETETGEYLSPSQNSANDSLTSQNKMNQYLKISITVFKRWFKK